MATWVGRLNQLLLEKALDKFDFKEVTFEEFKAFIEESAYVPGLDTDFIDTIYFNYLAKINIAGNKMTDKVATDSV